MALPGSGVISFNDVRTEMSQSAKSPYNMSGWVAGPNSGNIGAGVATYTPINILSSGSRWSLTNRLAKSNLSMSAWYGYDRTLSIPLNVTGTLYNHASSASSFDYQGSSTMLIVDAGTSNATYSINISGSYSSYDDDEKCLTIWYGKPWENDGVGTGSAVYTNVTCNPYSSVNTVVNYYYTYDSNKGQYLYFVLMDGQPY